MGYPRESDSVLANLPLRRMYIYANLYSHLTNAASGSGWAIDMATVFSGCDGGTPVPGSSFNLTAATAQLDSTPPSSNKTFANNRFMHDVSPSTLGSGLHHKYMFYYDWGIINNLTYPSGTASVRAITAGGAFTSMDLTLYFSERTGGGTPTEYSTNLTSMFPSSTIISNTSTEWVRTNHAWNEGLERYPHEKPSGSAISIESDGLFNGLEIEYEFSHNVPNNNWWITQVNDGGGWTPYVGGEIGEGDGVRYKMANTYPTIYSTTFYFHPTSDGNYRAFGFNEKKWDDAAIDAEGVKVVQWIYATLDVSGEIESTWNNTTTKPYSMPTYFSTFVTGISHNTRDHSTEGLDWLADIFDPLVGKWCFPETSATDWQPYLLAGGFNAYELALAHHFSIGIRQEIANNYLWSNSFFGGAFSEPRSMANPSGVSTSQSTTFVIISSDISDIP